jgi:pyruvate dehydrogenase E1 component beta subunit
MSDGSVSVSSAIHGVLADAMAAQDDVVVLCEGRGGWADALEARFAGRVHFMPVSDHATAAVAVGMALAGKRPVVELSSTGRWSALAEVLHEASAVAGHAGFHAPVVWRVPYGGEAGSRIDASALAGLVASGVQVLTPRDAGSAAGLMRAALSSGRPTILLEPRALARTGGMVDARVCPIGAAQEVRAGRHATVATWGIGVETALKVAESLSSEGIDVAVVDMVSLSPLDVQGLSRLASATGRLIVASGPFEASFGQVVLTAAFYEAFLYLEAPPTVCLSTAVAVTSAVRAAVNY